MVGVKSAGMASPTGGGGGGASALFDGHLEDGSGPWENVSPVVRAALRELERRLADERGARRELERRLAESEARCAEAVDGARRQAVDADQRTRRVAGDLREAQLALERLTKCVAAAAARDRREDCPCGASSLMPPKCPPLTRR